MSGPRMQPDMVLMDPGPSKFVANISLRTHALQQGGGRGRGRGGRDRGGGGGRSNNRGRGGGGRSSERAPRKTERAGKKPSAAKPAEKPKGKQQQPRSSSVNGKENKQPTPKAAEKKAPPRQKPPAKQGAPPQQKTSAKQRVPAKHEALADTAATEKGPSTAVEMLKARKRLKDAARRQSKAEVESEPQPQKRPAKKKASKKAAEAGDGAQESKPKPPPPQRPAKKKGSKKGGSAPTSTQEKNGARQQRGAKQPGSRKQAGAKQQPKKQQQQQRAKGRSGGGYRWQPKQDGPRMLLFYRRRAGSDLAEPPLISHYALRAAVRLPLPLFPLLPLPPLPLCVSACVLTHSVGCKRRTHSAHTYARAQSILHARPSLVCVR